MKKIKILLKNNRFLYLSFNFIGSFFLRFIGLFCKTDTKLILFNSFGGAKYDDSPKAIYEYMVKSHKYDDYKLIWAIDNPKILNKDMKFVKNNSLKFFITALRAKYWITNSSMERGLKFKKKQTIYINTWHGSVIKKIDTSKDKRVFKVTPSDYFYAQSQIDVDYFSEKWNYPKEKIILSGYPRNDELSKVTQEEIKKIKKKLNIPLNKKVIIYAPTFRDNDYDENGCYLAPPIDLKKWERILSNDYILIFRAHYEINKSLNIIENDFIKDYSDYPCLNDLLKISNIMISDYSSIMIDFSILERPIYCFAYDYEKYQKERGTAYDLRTELPNGIETNEDDLLKKIVECNYSEQKSKTIEFKKKHVEVYGDSASYIDIIIKE